jgi:N-methylhydantoinase A
MRVKGVRHFTDSKNGPGIFEHDKELYGAYFVLGMQFDHIGFGVGDKLFEIRCFLFVLQLGHIENQGLGIVPIAQELGCRAIIVPRTASVLSACGMQFSDIQIEESRTVPTRSDLFNTDAVNEGLTAIDEALDSFAEKLAARGFDKSEKSYRTDAHYAAQVWDIGVDLPVSRFKTNEEVNALNEAFHQSHQRIFNMDDRECSIEYLNWTGRVSIKLPQAGVGELPSTEQAITGQAGTDQAGTGSTREAYFDLSEKQLATVLKGKEIAKNQSIFGPAIIEEETTTLVLPPGCHATLSADGNYLVRWTD